MRTKIIITLAGLLLAGCATKTVNIDVINDDGKAVMALDYRDFDQAASEMIQSMIGSGALKKPGGGRYVMTTGRVTNDTMQRIDTDQLMAKIEEELMNSGMVVMTSAVGGKGAPDEMIYEMRDIRDSATGDEFKQETLAGRRTLIAPELSISGKIIQRNIRYDNNRQQVEYYFQLRITDLTTGLRFWQKESIIGKRGSNRSVAW
ncbi:MAG: penicillin-binding protein activator LpoB [Planctomycetes bacterium]|nr:penicillin-binding protein activator LpoB [Planctomycetota bacterium]MCH8121047.1 penicillin-binding protein activator LpoB [Planctomycetota bacterium]